MPDQLQDAGRLWEPHGGHRGHRGLALEATYSTVGHGSDAHPAGSTMRSPGPGRHPARKEQAPAATGGGGRQDRPRRRAISRAGVAYPKETAGRPQAHLHGTPWHLRRACPPQDQRVAPSLTWGSGSWATDERSSHTCPCLNKAPGPKDTARPQMPTSRPCSGLLTGTAHTEPVARQAAGSPPINLVTVDTPLLGRSGDLLPSRPQITSHRLTPSC